MLLVWAMTFNFIGYSILLQERDNLGMAQGEKIEI